VPFQLERRSQSVHPFIQRLHHAIIAAIDVDFTNPDRTRRFEVYNRVGRSNPGPGHPSKTFPHTFKKPVPIVVPLIMVTVADEIGHSFPISIIDCMEEMFCVEADLMVRSPKPEQIKADAQCNGQNADDCSTKRNCHTLEDKSDASADSIDHDFLKEGSTGSFTDWSRSQPSFSSVMCSIAIAFALASRSGRISYSETQHL
jgi:hypothetical protein